MGFVHKKQIILWKIIEQRKGTAPPRAAGHNTGIVFDSFAHADFFKHFHIVFGALAYSLRFQQLALLLKPPDPLLHFAFYIANSSVHTFSVDNIVGGGVYCGMGKGAFDLSGQGVYFAYTVDLVSEKFHSYGVFHRVCGEDFHNVSPDPEFVSGKVNIVALILYVHKAAKQIVSVHFLTRAERNHHIFIVNRIA